MVLATWSLGSCFEVGPFGDALEMLTRVAGLATAVPLTTASALDFEFTLGSVAFKFSRDAVEAGLKARSSCVDMELNSLVSATAGVDTKDLVAAGVLTSCVLVFA